MKDIKHDVFNPYPEKDFRKWITSNREYIIIDKEIKIRVQNRKKVEEVKVFRVIVRDFGSGRRLWDIVVLQELLHQNKKFYYVVCGLNYWDYPVIEVKIVSHELQIIG